MVTVSGPVWVKLWRIGLRTIPVRDDFNWAMKLVSSAAPLHGVPSWKTRLGRKVTAHDV